MIPCSILIKHARVLMPDMSIAEDRTIASRGSRILEVMGSQPYFAKAGACCG